MTTFPSQIDSDTELPRIDDNITEIGSEAINALRDAVFAIERNLGITAAGSMGSVSARLDVSLNANGTIKASALTSIGLATLPIVDSQVANNAGIKEFKLSLDYSTSDLHALILGNASLINSISSFAVVINSDLLAHISGAKFLANGTTLARHVASQIDINAVPNDSRDTGFSWTGLLNKNGVLRSATTVAQALLQINNELVDHENAIADAHPATSITVDTGKFAELPKTITNVQQAIDALDGAESRIFKPHRANLHANGISRTTRSQSFINPDGYGQSVVPATRVNTFLSHPPATIPVDSATNGDDIVQFVPDDSNFVFDSQFSKVKVGDIIRIQYGNGIETSFPVESIRFTPGSDWTVRINGLNIYDGYGFARIDRPLFDTKTDGILAVASANQPLNATIMGSVIVADPKCANALGLGFNASKLDSAHYNLYLQLYPTGNPADKIISLPAIDVTGNAGITPGQYTLDTVVQATNNAFRAPGFNYRFIAFSHNGEFGVAVADVIGGAGFSIVNGTVGSGTLAAGSFTNNVIGDATDGIDPLGFGINQAGIASPVYSATFTAAVPAIISTQIILPLKNRKYDVNGIERDDFKTTLLTVEDGYWPANITARTPVGTSTIEVTYTVPLDLTGIGLFPGKTIVVQPAVAFGDPTYNDVDYGRFIIKQIGFDTCCGPSAPSTLITVVNGIHATGAAVGFSSAPLQPVKIYFGQDSISFDSNNVVDAASNTTVYDRFHEIYVDESGHTFTHERARMPFQGGTSTLLDTIDSTGPKEWNLTSVSPKLRGFNDDSSSSLDRFVRFYVLSYDSTTGDYDGYLGKRDSSNANISKNGLIVTGRKGVSTKFYDETNVDYIEIEFVDKSSSGVSIAPGPRYVDIQVFPSLELDNEFFLIGSCEVKGTTVTKIRDLRQFGNVSEKNFTNSAIDFIRANDRELRENGIVRGFDYTGTSSDAASNPKILNYTGGVALVNGALVTVNNSSVEIPQIYISGGSLPQTVLWAICVNKNGQLQPMLLTAIKLEFFANPGYFVDSCSFFDIVNNRKDLVIIDIVTATISSIILSRTDARKYIVSEGLNTPLTWCGTWDGSQIVGNFNTLESLINWIKNYRYVTNKIIVRGQFDINETIDLSKLTSGTDIYIVFEGENAVFNINVGKGIILGSRITFKNIEFKYNPTGVTYDSADLVCIGNGCLYRSITTGIVDCVIDSCRFLCDPNISSQRPPFISLELKNDALVDGLIIKNCRFEDTSFDLGAAIAITTNNSGTATTPAIVANTIIANNICVNDQGIYITTNTSGTSTVVANGPGIAVINTFIKENNCAFIGYFISNNFISTVPNGATITSSLDIVGNICKFIGPLDSKGRFIRVNRTSGSAFTYGTGNVSILNNKCNWLYAYCQNSTDPAQILRSSLSIKNNTLRAADTGIFSGGFFGPYSGSLGNQAMFVAADTAITSNYASVIIDGNNIDSDVFDGIITYPEALQLLRVSAIVSNNYLSGVSNSSTIITIYGGNSPMLSVHHNHLMRRTSHINHYILATDTDLTGYIVDNFFDSSTIDGSTQEDYSSGKLVIERNKNQINSTVVRGFDLPGIGSFCIDDILYGVTNLEVQILKTTQDDGFVDIFIVQNASALRTIKYNLDLSGVIPKGATILHISSIIRSDKTLPSASSALMSLQMIPTTNTAVSAPAVLSTPYVAFTDVPMEIIPLAANPDPGAWINSDDKSPKLTMSISANNNSSNDATISFDTFYIKYRW